jgi:hypothetical protein
VHHESFSDHENCGCCPDGIIPSNKRKLSAITSVVDHKASNDNPILNLNIMQLTEDGFTDCRMKDHRICIYDGISKFRGCNMTHARKQFERITGMSNYVSFQLEYLNFPRSDGQMGQPVPCCDLSTLLKILSELPGRRGRALRKHILTIGTDSTLAMRNICSTGECRFIVNNDVLDINANVVNITTGKDRVGVTRTHDNKWNQSDELNASVDDMLAVTLPKDDIILTGYIYFARIGDTNHVKIGTTIDLERRLNSLQTAVPLGDLRYIHTLKVNNRFIVETEIHQVITCDGLRLRDNGEWFVMPTDRVLHYCEILAGVASKHKTQ